MIRPEKKEKMTGFKAEDSVREVLAELAEEAGLTLSKYMRELVIMEAFDKNKKLPEYLFDNLSVIRHIRSRYTDSPEKMARLKSLRERLESTEESTRERRRAESA